MKKGLLLFLLTILIVSIVGCSSNKVVKEKEEVKTNVQVETQESITPLDSNEVETSSVEEEIEKSNNAPIPILPDIKEEDVKSNSELKHYTLKDVEAIPELKEKVDNNIKFIKSGEDPFKYGFPIFLGEDTYFMVSKDSNSNKGVLIKDIVYSEGITTIYYTFTDKSQLEYDIIKLGSEHNPDYSLAGVYVEEKE